MPIAEEQIRGVTRKMNGWIEVETSVRRYGTKREDIAKEALALVGQTVSFEFHSRDGNINPHTGQPYQNYYFDGIVDNPAPALEIPAEQPQAAPGRKTDPDDAWRMALTSGAKLAVQTMPLMPREECTPENQRRIALWWAVWIVGTQRPEQAPEAAVGDDNSSTYSTYAATDDDIPF